MKPYLIVENGSHELTTINYFEGEINSVGYFVDGDYITLNDDSKGNLADNIVWKDNGSIKKLETLLADELEKHNDIAHDIAHATDTGKMLKLQIQYNIQESKIVGIEKALKLLQGGE
ncbi:hypothetical protein BK128_08370 [Viridibacillus sp. FSL H7-0596]|uniref:hypothetical protein n=1 Tax=Viridibacillus sp. FSL H7-0596 TaxID=1928923 RepID=UPI00096C0DD4|nr:hypothetical protein [Viridibacillus sp. FSL H7-0596]OMC87432.1 hypothetical protein BK128_08370 [Viridibacillus sp. FSL H7-0596]